MSLLEKINADRTTARRAKNTVTADLLGTLLGAMTTKRKSFSPERPLTEAEEIAEVKKLLDGVLETGRLIHGQVGRERQIVQNETETRVLLAYMPQQMDEAAIEQFARAKQAEGLPLGAIMAALKTAHPGAYDGKLASQVVKRVLA